MVPSVVVAVFVVSSFCALCLVYLLFVGSRPYSCCCSERRVNNSVCSCHGCYTHIYLYWVMWPYRKVMYVHCAQVLYLVEKKQVLPWVDSVLCGIPPVARVTYFFFFFFFFFPSPSFSDHSGHRSRARKPMWDSEKLYLMSPPCPPFPYPLSWPFPHPSVPLLLFSGHRRRDMQIRSGR